MKCFSLFSGIGGFDLALEKQGHEIVGACEIDRYARQVYARHFPKTRIWKDATDINPKEIPDFELLVAGFPCQTFSVAGKRLGFEESRGTLFFEIARIVREKRPRLLLLENVKGLLSHDGGKTFAVILSVLDELGYDAQWQVLNSKYFVPQNRERVFIIGHSRDSTRPKVFPIQERCTGNNQARPKTPELNITMPCLTPNRLHRRQQGRRFKENGEPSFTLTAQDQHGISDGDQIRRLTPLECERLQGFPDNWTKELSDTQRYKCLGNAVTVPVIQYILELIP